MGIYAALSYQSEEQVLKEFGGQGFGVFKPKLADLAVSTLEPINNELKKLLQEKGETEVQLIVRQKDTKFTIKLENPRKFDLKLFNEVKNR